MAILESLTLVELKSLHSDAVLNRRRKLIRKLDEQIHLAKGQQLPAEKRGTKKFAHWWHESSNGRVLLTVNYCGRPLELAEGKVAIEIESLDLVAKTLELLRQAAEDGEFDALLDPKRRLRRLKGETPTAA